MFRECSSQELINKIRIMQPGDQFDFVADYNPEDIENVEEHAMHYGVKCIYEFDLRLVLIAMYGMGFEFVINLDHPFDEWIESTLQEFINDYGDDLKTVIIKCDEGEMS